MTAFLRWKVFEHLAAEGSVANDLTDATLGPVAHFKAQLGARLEQALVVERSTAPTGRCSVPAGCGARRPRSRPPVSRLSGARAICGALEEARSRRRLRASGGQNVAFSRRCGGPWLRTVVPTSEIAAGFAAAGFAAASGRPASSPRFPGPGFAYALPAIAEARLDSLPLVVVAVAPREGGIALPLQAFDQAAVAAPLVKEVLSADVEGAAASVRRALALAVSGEPGPVLVHVSERTLEARDADAPAAATVRTTADAAVVAGLAARLTAAERVVLHVGGGAADYAADVVALVERVGAVAISTTSGRGVVPEDHPRSLAVDAPGAGASALNELLDAADLVLALGVKYSHNGALGGALRIDPRRFVRVDASAAVLAAAYPANTAVEADIPTFVRALLDELPAGPAPGWPEDELARLRPRLDRAARTRLEPGLRVAGAEAPRDFFAALRVALARDGVLVTDSGLHQQLARTHFRVLATAHAHRPDRPPVDGVRHPGRARCRGRTAGSPGRRARRRRWAGRVRARARHCRA